MLVSSAALVTYSWPFAPRWKLRTDILVGFDEKRHLLLTTPRTNPGLGGLPVETPLVENTLEVRGYDLRSGQRIFSRAYNLSAAKVEDGIWLPIISPDDDSLLAIDRGRGVLQVFDLETGALRCHFGIIANGEAFGFSADGKYFAACGAFTNKLEVYDLSSGKTVHSIPIDNGLFSPGGSGPSYFSATAIQISAGYHLAAVELEHRVVLFDLDKEVELRRMENAIAPRFHDNGKSLTTLTDRPQARETKLYKVDGQVVQEADPPIDELQRLGCVNQTMYVSAKEKPLLLPDWLLWMHLPDNIHQAIASWLGFPKARVEYSVHELSSGEPLNHFTIYLPGHDFWQYPFSADAISADGSLLTLTRMGEISLWDVPPHHSAICWIVCASIIALALWFAWPRKVKAT
jgi:WD40 repeat protein